MIDNYGIIRLTNRAPARLQAAGGVAQEDLTPMQDQSTTSERWLPVVGSWICERLDHFYFGLDADEEVVWDRAMRYHAPTDSD